MKKLVSILMILALALGCVSALADDQTGSYDVYNATGETVTELYLQDNVTGAKSPNLAGENGLKDGAYTNLSYSIPEGEDGSHRLTLSFVTESGYEGAFTTLTIEVAPITLLSADASATATKQNQIRFVAQPGTGIYTVTNVTGEDVTDLYLIDNTNKTQVNFLSGDAVLANDASIELAYTVPAAAEGSHRLTLTFVTASGYEGSFTTLTIEVAPIYLLSADAASSATNGNQISFRKPE